MTPRQNPQFSALVPPLSTADFEALRLSIERDGVLVPIDVDESGDILDGNHRFQIAGKKCPVRVLKGLSELQKTAHVLRSACARRNLSPDQRREIDKVRKQTAIALRKADVKYWTQARLGRELGVAQGVISRWTASGTNMRAHISSTPKPDARVKVPATRKPEIAERVERGERKEQIAADFGITRRAVARIAESEKKQKDIKERRKQSVAKAGSTGIIHGDFRAHADKIKDGSVDLIFTDPPYDEKSLELYAGLADFADAKLRPGGLCLTYSGQMFLPRIYEIMGSRLVYMWTAAVVHRDGANRFRKWRFQVGWKPILVYGKAPVECWWDWCSDVVSGGKEKADHEWQQAESEAAHFIGRMCPAKGLVVDPFCGSGTTLVAAKRLGMQIVGFEIDKSHFEAATERLVEV